jgi:exportin-2 (importin alpha re-exporter)
MGDEAQLTQLSACLMQTLSPDQASREQAEDFLKSGATSPGFSLLLMRLLAAETAEAQVRQSAAVTFKNIVKSHWVEKEPDVVGAPPPYAVGADEKAQVRGLIVSLMLSAPKLVQAQLSEALSIVSAADFPEQWPGLLPELIARLGNPGARDFAAVVGVLTTANTIFKRYRQAYKSDDLYKELKYVLDTFVAPLLTLLKEVSAGIQANAGNPELLVSLFACLRLICRIFYSLNSQELPEVFEDNMDAWMGEFHNYLGYENPALAALENNKDREKAGVVDSVKAAICDNVNLYIEKNEEEFQRFLQTFVQDVWTLLTKTGLEPNKDHLVTSGVRFLTTVANSVHHSLFAGGDTLRQVCESIIIPNLQFREDDEELFESNHVEYIRRDIEGSDSDTRRRGACELVKGLTAKFPEVMTASVSGYVTALLGQYAASPATSWKAKDAAVYLVISLVVKSKSAVKGATETNELVSIVDFYSTQIAPELAAAAAGGGAGGDAGRAVLYADALKFLTIFRSQVPKAMVLPVLPAIVQLLAAEENVVHTYAANCLERLLTTKEPAPPGAPAGTRPTPRYAAADLQPLVQPLLTNLFGVFQLPDSQENEYAMKAVMRTVGFLGEGIKPVAGVCLQALSGMVMETCKNPRNPTFSHYLFESVAALLRHANDPALIGTFEQMLFPPFQHVLQQDVVEFAPYVFQLLSQMIEIHPGTLPPAYMGIFPALLVPLLWDRQANVTPLVRLLEAYLRKAPQEVVSSGHLTGILGVFQKLAASRAQDHQGFFILNAFVECLALPAWIDHLPAVWGILFSRLQTSKTVKFTKSLVVFISLLGSKHGAAVVSESMAKVQPGVFEMVLTGVVADAIGSIAGVSEEKVVAVAGARFLTECPSVLAQDAAWAKLLTAVVTMLEKPEEDKGGDGDDDAELEEMEAKAGLYSTSSIQLALSLTHSLKAPGFNP